MGAAERHDVLASLVAERGGALWRYAYLISGDVDDAADLVQDALVHTFSRSVPPAKAEAYVRRAILNGAIDRGRRATTWRSIRHLAVVPDGTADGTPESDARVDMMRMVRALPPRQRACVVLRYYEDLPVAAIAETLGIAVGSVKRYLSDGVAALAARFEAEGRGEAAETTGADHA